MFTFFYPARFYGRMGIAHRAARVSYSGQSVTFQLIATNREIRDEWPQADALIPHMSTKGHSTMRSLRFALGLLVMSLLLLHAGLPADAATVGTFTREAFKTAQAANEPILVDISATWCPPCARQKPIINGLAATPEFAKLVILHVDFDSQKDVVRAMGARMQSTLIVFHGANLKGISVGDTDPTSIKALLVKSLD